MAERRAGPAGQHHVRRAVRLAAIPAAAWYAVLVGSGLLIAGAVRGAVSGEDGLVEALQDGRSPSWDDVTHWVSWSANTGTIILAACVVGLVLRLVLRQWVEPLVLWAGVALQSALFLLTTLAVSRPRPDAAHLDPAPPTSSFPSGHTGASMALWLGLALVLATRVRSRALRVVIVLVLACIPVAVAVSRLDRGMHHPSDVAFGLLNGVAAVCIVRFAVYHDLRAADPAGQSSLPARSRSTQA